MPPSRAPRPSKVSCWLPSTTSSGRTSRTYSASSWKAAAWAHTARRLRLGPVQAKSRHGLRIADHHEDRLLVLAAAFAIEARKPVGSLKSTGGEAGDTMVSWCHHGKEHDPAA